MLPSAIGHTLPSLRALALGDRGVRARGVGQVIYTASGRGAGASSTHHTPHNTHHAPCTPAAADDLPLWAWLALSLALLLPTHATCPRWAWLALSPSLSKPLEASRSCLSLRRPPAPSFSTRTRSSPRFLADSVRGGTVWVSWDECLKGLGGWEAFGRGRADWETPARKPSILNPKAGRPPWQILNPKP